MPSDPPPWSASQAVGFSIVGAAGASVAVLWGLSWAGARTAVTAATAEHVASEAGLVAATLDDLPVEVLAGLGEGHASAAISRRLEVLMTASGLHDAAVVAPDGTVLGSGGTWLPAAAESDLVARASGGVRVAGTLHRAADGEWYATGYAPLPSHPGYVVAVEASATLGPVEGLARGQAAASTVVLAVAAAVAAGLAVAVTRPLRHLEADLAHVEPGDPPERVTLRGPREVWLVSAALRRLLGAVRERDRAVQAAHREQMTQLSRLAAEVAHEVRNPLNAVSLSIDRLERLEDADRRRTVASRLREQVGELDAIAHRLLDLARPLSVTAEDVDALGIARHLAEDQGLELVAEGCPPSVRADRALATAILRNLLSNARQAGARSVHLRGSPEWLEVEDDGPGLDDVEGVFAWFHTTRAGGSGLGLPTARRMAEAMGGGLTCRQGRPAVFRWTFDRSREER